MLTLNDNELEVSKFITYDDFKLLVQALGFYCLHSQKADIRSEYLYINLYDLYVNMSQKHNAITDEMLKRLISMP